MSNFATLRATRQAKEKQKSYLSQTQSGEQQDIQSTSVSASKVAEISEGLYKAWPTSNFEICVSSDSLRGRGVFSRKQYRPGDILVSVKPNISVLSIASLPKCCSACATPAPTDINGLKRCPNCKVIYYCGTDCQTRDWSLHKQECIALQSWAKAAPSPEVAIPSDAVRCLGRILWRRKKSGNQSVFTEEINAMQSHRTSLQPSSYELHTHLAHALVRYLNISSPEDMAEYGLSSIADLVDLISRFTTNTVALTTPSLIPIGASVSPSMALLNHSCDPNVVVIFPRTSANPKSQEPLLQGVVIKPIDPGEELLTSYIDTTLCCEDRQKSLKETYSFDCKCPLCVPTSINFVDPREALLCPTRKDPSRRTCDGLCQIPKEDIIEARCNTCNSLVNPNTIGEILDAISISCDGLEKARDLQYKDPGRAMRLTSNLIGILTSAGLAPGAHPLLGLARLHSAMLIENLPDLGAILGPILPSQHDLLSDSSKSSTQTGISTLQQTYTQEQEQKQASPQTVEEKTHVEEAQQKLDDAIRAALRTSTGLATVLVPGHPLRGLALAELGKLLSVDEPVPKYLGENNHQKVVYPPSGPARLRIARETLLRARSELMVGFGGANEGGEVGREVRGWLIRVEKELEVWKAGIQGISQG
ncbi:hypothetical protein AX15_001693 [Amanita polypyramis BW_CC]|nr:hypothetical protein AX15_001693 [Amanita polypyramis BW_CC]